MKIDFHTHSKLAKGLPFSPEYTKWHLQQAKLAGLDAICVTEHYNGTEMVELFNYFQSELKKDGDAFVTEDELIVFMGLEIDAVYESGSGHFLTIGEINDIRDIYKKLQPFLQISQHPTFNELVAIVKNHPVMFGVSHPFRTGKTAFHLQKDDLRLLDFLDLNGKDTALDPTNENLINSLSADVNIPILAGSDTHQANQFGCIYNQFNSRITSVKALHDAVKNKAYTVKHGENPLFKVKTAKLIKSALKEIHNLGGDYVSVILK